MFSHVMVGTDDLEKSKKFYDAVLATLGIGPGFIDEDRRIFYVSPTGVFAVSKPINGKPATPANGRTMKFAAADPATVYAWRSRVPEFDAAYRAAIEMRADWLVAKGEEYATNMDMPASDASLRAKLLFQAAGLRSRRYAPRRGDEDTRAAKTSLPELSEEDLLRIVAQGQKKLERDSVD